MNYLHVAEFTRILKKCELLEVAGGCLCWRVESSDVHGHAGQRQNTLPSAHWAPDLGFP